MKYNIVHPAAHSGEYLGSSIEIQVASDDHKVIIGAFKRTGITRPGFPSHPVYKFEQGYLYGFHPGEIPDGYFVFDGQEFYEVVEWHRSHAPEKVKTQKARAKK